MKSLVIPRRVLPDGMIFVICKNEHVGEAINHFELQDFKYAENIVIVPIKKEYHNTKGSNNPAKKRVEVNPISSSITIDDALVRDG